MLQQMNTPEGANLNEQVYRFLKNQNLRSDVLKETENGEKWVREMVLNHQFCTVSLNRLRYSAICQGCSGNAASYIGVTHMKLSQSKCSLIVKSCSKTWFYIHSLITSVKALWAGTVVIYAEDKSQKAEPMKFVGETGRDSLMNIDFISKVLDRINLE